MQSAATDRRRTVTGGKGCARRPDTRADAGRARRPGTGRGGSRAPRPGRRGRLGLYGGGEVRSPADTRSSTAAGIGTGGKGVTQRPGPWFATRVVVDLVLSGGRSGSIAEPPVPAGTSSPATDPRTHNPPHAERRRVRRRDRPPCAPAGRLPVRAPSPGARLDDDELRRAGWIGRDWIPRPRTVNADRGVYLLRPAADAAEHGDGRAA